MHSNVTCLKHMQTKEKRSLKIIMNYVTQVQHLDSNYGDVVKRGIVI